VQISSVKNVLAISDFVGWFGKKTFDVEKTQQTTKECSVGGAVNDKKHSE